MFAMSSREARTARTRVGGVVVVADYQGQDIGRRLGRHGVPVCLL
jgi:hypothetical protein